MARPIVVISISFLLACGSESAEPSQTSDDGGVDTGDLIEAGPEVALDPPVDPFREAALAAVATLTTADLDRHLAVLAADEMEGRDNLTEGGERARVYLEEQLESIGLTPLGRDGYRQPFSDGVNLAGLLPGSDTEVADEYVIIGAHYDHLGLVSDTGSQCRSDGSADDVCNGAADNASGCATVLMLARAFAESEVGLRRSLVVLLFDAEEDGLLGSHHLTEEDPLVPLDDVVTMFNVDNIGTEIIPGSRAIFVVGMDYSEGLREFVHANNEALGTGLYPVAMKFDMGGSPRSDHGPFAEQGVPIAFYSSGSAPDYHTPADEIDTVDSDLALETISHALLTVADAANGENRPIFVEGPGSHIEDAIALVDLGEAVLADPEALGLSDQFLIDLVQGYVDDLNEWIRNPPQTESEWARYQSLVDEVLGAVTLFAG